MDFESSCRSSSGISFLIFSFFSPRSDVSEHIPTLARNGRREGLIRRGDKQTEFERDARRCGFSHHFGGGSFCSRPQLFPLQLRAEGVGFRARFFSCERADHLLTLEYASFCTGVGGKMR